MQDPEDIAGCSYSRSIGSIDRAHGQSLICDFLGPDGVFPVAETAIAVVLDCDRRDVCMEIAVSANGDVFMTPDEGVVGLQSSQAKRWIASVGMCRVSHGMRNEVAGKNVKVLLQGE